MFFLFLDLFGDTGGDNVSEGSAIVRCRTDASFMTTLTMWLIQNPHSITVIKHECKLLSFMFFVKYVFSINFSFCVLNLNNDSND